MWMSVDREDPRAIRERSCLVLNKSEFESTDVDIDSYVVVAKALSAFSCGIKFELHVLDTIYFECKNKKITNKLDEYFENQGCETERDHEYIEFRIGQNDCDTVRVLIRAKHSVGNRHFNFRTSFFNQVIVPAIKKLPSTCQTVKNCGNLFTTRKNATVNVHDKDYEKFCQYVNEYTSDWNNLQRDQVEDILFYICEHGLKATPTLVLDRISRSVNENDTSILFYQLHVATTLIPRDPDEMLLIDVDEVTKVLGADLLRYRKFFHTALGSFSNCKSPRFSDFDYIQSYETTAHLLPTHNFVSLMCFASIFKSEYVHKENKEKGEKQLEQLAAYVKGVKSSPDLRIEYVESFKNLRIVTNEYFDIENVRIHGIGKLLNTLIKTKCIYRYKDWAEYVERTGEYLLSYIQEFFKTEKTILTRKQLDMLYFAEHGLYKWIEDNTSRYDYRVKSYFFPKPRWLKMSTNSLDFTIPSSVFGQLPVSYIYREHMKFLYEQSLYVMHKEITPTPSPTILFQFYASLREYKVRNFIVRYSAYDSESYYKMSQNRKQHIKIQVFFEEVVDAVLTPTSPFLKSINSYIYGESLDSNKGVIRRFIKDHVHTFPCVFLSSSAGYKLDEWASVMTRMNQVNRNWNSSNQVLNLIKLNTRFVSKGVQHDATPEVEQPSDSDSLDLINLYRSNPWTYTATSIAPTMQPTTSISATNAAGIVSIATVTTLQTTATITTTTTTTTTPSTTLEIETTRTTETTTATEASTSTNTTLTKPLTTAEAAALSPAITTTLLATPITTVTTSVTSSITGITIPTVQSTATSTTLFLDFSKDGSKPHDDVVVRKPCKNPFKKKKSEGSPPAKRKSLLAPSFLAEVAELPSSSQVHLQVKKVLPRPKQTVVDDFFEMPSTSANIRGPSTSERVERSAPEPKLPKQLSMDAFLSVSSTSTEPPPCTIRTPAIEFTAEEDAAIIRYALSSKNLHQTKGRKIWELKKFRDSSWLPNRSVTSIMSRIKKIAKKNRFEICRLGFSEEEVTRIKNHFCPKEP